MTWAKLLKTFGDSHSTHRTYLTSVGNEPTRVNCYFNIANKELIAMPMEVFNGFGWIRFNKHIHFKKAESREALKRIFR